jgi:hypothetical protein
MSLFNKVLKGVGKAAINVASDVVSQSQKSAYQKSNQSDRKISCKTFKEWDREWRSVGILSQLILSPYNRYVGLYRAWLGSELVYIGRAIEWNNGGFRKRLSDYTRNSDNARTHGSGQKMHQYRD